MSALSPFYAASILMLGVVGLPMEASGQVQHDYILIETTDNIAFFLDRSTLQKTADYTDVNMLAVNQPPTEGIISYARSEERFYCDTAEFEIRGFELYDLAGGLVSRGKPEGGRKPIPPVSKLAIGKELACRGIEPYPTIPHPRSTGDAIRLGHAMIYKMRQIRKSLKPTSTH